MRVCYASLYDDQTAADLPPASSLDRRALLRHLPREMVSRGHEAIVVHQFSRRHTLVEDRVRHELVPSPRWMRAAAAIVGRVAMNMVVLDVTASDASADEDVVLIGRQEGAEIGVEELAEKSGTISYETLSRIHPSLPRHVVSS